MPVYGLLARFMPAPVAGVACAVFYAVMLITIILLLPVNPADFRYGNY